MTPPRSARLVRETRLQPLARWRIATAVLAVTTAFFALRSWSSQRGASPFPGPSGDGPSHVAAASASRAATMRQLRIPGHLVGFDEDQILRELEHARSLQQIQVLCERLGFVGTDRSLDLLGKLAHDRRSGVAEAAIGAIGHIGTDEATSALIALLDGTSVRVRGAAVAALGQTGQARARERLIQLASRRGDAQRTAAIYALGEMGGDDVIEMFRAMPDRSRPVMQAMVQAAATMGSEESEAFLLDLARSDGVHAEVRAAALAALPASKDEERQSMLMEVLASGDPGSAAAAAQVLGRSGAEQSVPLLLDVARSGNSQASYAALAALGEIGSETAVRALGDLAARGPAQLAQQATFALAQADTPASRAMLMAAAKSPTGDRSAALQALTQVGGDEVEALFVEVAKTGELRDRQSALQHLVQIGHPDAAKMVVELATTGSRQQRQSFLYMMSQLDDDVARDALWSMAKSSSGSGKVQALDMLAQAAPSDPKVTSMLVDMLQNGRREEAGSAAYSLARGGSPEGRDALLAALSTGDRQMASTALGAVGQMLGDGELASAVAQAARSATDPQVKQAALAQLLQNRLPEGVEVAEQMLRSGKSEQASQAIQALAYAPGPDAQKLVREAAGAEDSQVRAMAASSLAQSTDAGSSQMLLQLSRDRDPQVRTAALSGLGQVGSTEAVGTLIEVARAGETQDRQAAIQALAYSDDSRASGTIAQLIGSSDPEVAGSAINASYSGGRDVDQALIGALASESQQVKMQAAYQLRSRGTRVGSEVQGQIEGLIGAER